MKIMVTGLCSLHWGRLEFGNIGNYYIIEPFFRQLHRVFPNAQIVTTFQMTEEFQKRENVTVLPIDIYYAWQPDDVSNAYVDFGVAEYYSQTGKMPYMTPFLKEVLDCSLVIDVSGEMWGDYAEPVGKDRFLVHLLKERSIQLLSIPLVLFAGSQGPFTNDGTNDFAKLVYEKFSTVMAREPLTNERINKLGFNTGNTKLYACPAFLFEPESPENMHDILTKEQFNKPGDTRPVVGLSISGFNFAELPYDKWPRDDSEYENWAVIAEHIVRQCNARLILISHTNGFDLPPNFKLKPGRDYYINKQLYDVLLKRGVISDTDIHCIQNAYLPKQTKAIIGALDMLVSGRAHAMVAAMSQSVPTVGIVYNEAMQSTKTIGFAALAGMDNYVAYAESTDDILIKIDKCWTNRTAIKAELKEKIPKIQAAARHAFDDLVRLIPTQPPTVSQTQNHILRTTLCVTQRCTLKCKLCLAFSPYYENPKDVTVDDARKILDTYFKIVDAVDIFNVTGGEPLLNKKLVQIMKLLYDYKNQVNKSIDLVTNGTLEFSEDLLSLLSANSDKTRVIISDYGVLSTKLQNVINSLEKYKILYRVAKLHGDDLYYGGWIDFRNHSQQHFTIEDRDEQGRRCIHRVGRYFVIDNGELHGCSRSFWRTLQGIIPKVKGEYVDLLDDSIPLEEKRADLANLAALNSGTSCAYCLGLTNDRERFYPAEQLHV